MLGVAASGLLVIYDANVTKLIPLYAFGVFVSFTLSQGGMVKHWLRLREPGWRLSMIVNGFGATTTAVVAIIIGATKFSHGAWISMAGDGHPGAAVLDRATALRRRGTALEAIRSADDAGSPELEDDDRAG